MIKNMLTTIVLFYATVATSQQAFDFKPLPYSYDALEQFIDKTTMEIHYSRHHRGYYNNFLKGIEENNLAGKSLNELFAEVGQLPTTIKNNGGGWYNHTLFWEIMSPTGGGKPGNELLKALEKRFQSFENFQKEFETAAMTRFGSGWAWLSVDKDGNLFVSSTPNQDNPLMNVVEKQGVPILALDVWEHAYYLQYQNKRADYVANFWKVVNWQKVEELYKKAITR